MRVVSEERGYIYKLGAGQNCAQGEYEGWKQRGQERGSDQGSASSVTMSDVWVNE